MASSAHSNCSRVSIIVDHLHNTPLFHVARELIDAQPGGQYHRPNGLGSPEDVRLEEQTCPLVLKDILLWRRQSSKLLIEAFLHEQENIQVSGKCFVSDATAPDKYTPQFPGHSG